MDHALLPLFPLQVVLFPRALLPLHIFEERYKDMIRDVRASHPEFGVVLARANGVANVGCTATIREILKEYPDGRLDILTVGVRRFEILLINQEKSYLRAGVEFFDDEESLDQPPLDALRQAVASYEILRRMLPDQLERLNPQDRQLSFQLCRGLSDLDERQVLLSMRSEHERLQKLAELLPLQIARQRLINQVRRVAPTNGHSHRKVKLE